MSLLVLKKIMAITFREILVNILPSLLLSLGMAVVTYFAIALIDSMLIKLLAGAFIALITYISLSLIVKSQDLKDIYKIFKTK